MGQLDAGTQERAAPQRADVVAVPDEPRLPIDAAHRLDPDGRERRAAVRDARRVRAEEVERAELVAVGRRLEVLQRLGEVEAVEALRLVGRAKARPREEHPTVGPGIERDGEEVLGQQDAAAGHLLDLHDPRRGFTTHQDGLAADHHGQRLLAEEDGARGWVVARGPEVHPVGVGGGRGPREVTVVTELDRGRAHEREARHVQRPAGSGAVHVVHPHERRALEALVGIARDEWTSALGEAARERPVVARARRAEAAVQVIAERGEALGEVSPQALGTIGPGQRMDLRSPSARIEAERRGRPLVGRQHERVLHGAQQREHRVERRQVLADDAAEHLVLDEARVAEEDQLAHREGIDG